MMWARLIWWLDERNHGLPERFQSRWLCDLNERLVTGETS